MLERRNSLMLSLKEKHNIHLLLHFILCIFMDCFFIIFQINIRIFFYLEKSITVLKDCTYYYSIVLDFHIFLAVQ